MTDLHAKPIIENKFWIVEKDGEKFATLRKTTDSFSAMKKALESMTPKKA